MATNHSFNTTTFAFPLASVTLGPLRSINKSQQAPDVDVSGSADTERTVQCGLPKTEFTVGLLGNVSTAIGTKGTCVATWTDGTTDTKSNCVLLGNDTSGSLDGAIETTLKFGQSKAAT